MYGSNYYRIVSFRVNDVEMSRFAPIEEQEIIDVSLAVEYLKKFALQGGA